MNIPEGKRFLQCCRGLTCHLSLPPSSPAQRQTVQENPLPALFTYVGTHTQTTRRAHSPALSPLQADADVLLEDPDTAFPGAPPHFIPHSEKLTASSARSQIASLERSWVEKSCSLVKAI